MTRGQMAGIGVVAVGAVLGIGGALSGGDSKSPPRAQTGRTPSECLTDAGLTDVSQRGTNTWRGFHQQPFFAVFVQDAGTPTEASTQISQADLVIGEAAGRFSVTGPSVETDDQGVVAKVASCLDG